MTEYWEKWGRGRPSKEKIERRKKHHAKMKEMIQDGRLPFLKAILEPESFPITKKNGRIKVQWINRNVEA